MTSKRQSVDVRDFTLWVTVLIIATVIVSFDVQIGDWVARHLRGVAAVVCTVCMVLLGWVMLKGGRNG